MKKLLILLPVVAALPFISFGVVGFMRYLHVNEMLYRYFGMDITENPVRNFAYLGIGLGVYFLLKLVVDRR